MREGDFVNVGDEEPTWDEVVALDPEDVASIRVDPDLDDFLPNGRGLDEEDDEPDVEDDDPDFDDAEMSLLQDLGIDLDASDDPIGGLDLDLVLEPESESESESEDSADDDAAA